MGKMISQWLYRASGAFVTLTAVLSFVLFVALILPAQSAQSESYAAEVISPDTSFIYTPEALYGAAEAYGEAGRGAYIRSRFTFDLVWPLTYAFFLATAISWVYGRAFPPDHPWRLANLAPVLAASLDYLENLCISLVMYRYPARTPFVDTLAPVFTMAKWSLIAASFALLLFGLFRDVSTWWRDRS